MPLDLELLQKQSLSLLQMQSLGILTATTQELLGIIEQRAAQNPLMTLKREDRGLGSIRTSRHVTRAAEAATEKYDEYLNSIPEREENLRQHLERQIPSLGLNPREERMCSLVISALDSRGFLAQDPRELVEDFDDGIGNEPPAGMKEDASSAHEHGDCREDKLSLFGRMAGLISGLDPVGCAATDVYDSLRKQLFAREDELLAESVSLRSIELAMSMIDKNDFTLYSKSRMSEIASRHGVTLEEAENAFSVIRKLDPNPARDYLEAPIRYVAPSIFASVIDNEIKVSVRDDFLPSIGFDGSYDNGELSKKDMRFVENCRKDVESLVSMIESREKALSEIAYFMVSKQINWLTGKTHSKAPLMLKDIARYANVSMSTASRIVNSNYLQFERSVFALSDLLERSPDGRNGKGGVADAIREIIASSESKLSDEKIRKILEERGIAISRRTVQKYRTLGA